MKLLVPVDGSNASMKAVEKSIEIAKKDGSSIKLINVVTNEVSRRFKRNEQMWRQVDGSLISGRATTLDIDDVSSKLQKNSEELLDLIIQKYDFGNILVEKEVLVGDPYSEIIDIADKEDFDLIVMGNRGYSKIKSFFVGSVTQRVIAESKCPVLVIHSDCEE